MPSPVDMAPGFPLAKLLNGGKLAMADPNAVPAGKYGKAALTKLGVWDAVAGSVAAAENVRACLLLVARGEAPLGIVYKTDASIEPKVKIVATFPADSMPPIIYPIAPHRRVEEPRRRRLRRLSGTASAIVRFRPASPSLIAALWVC